MSEPVKLKWIIAHQPAYLFIRTAKLFQRKLDEFLPGQFEVEILTFSDYIKNYNDIEHLDKRLPDVGDLTDWDQYHGTGERTKNVHYQTGTRDQIKAKWNNFFQGLRDGKFHMTQTQINVIGSHLDPKYHSLDLPFIFNSHDHVTEALDGEIGKQLNDGLAQTGVRGLAFTYSGGYRVIGANRELKGLDDVREGDLMALHTAAPMFNKSGIAAKNASRSDIQEHQHVADGNGCVETTYLRFAGKHVLKTNHSMFLTNIMIGEELFQSLTQDQQEAFKKAALICSKKERAWSLEDAQKYEDTAAERGVTINTISEDDNLLLRATSAASYSTAFNKYPEIEPVAEAIIKVGEKVH